LRQRRFLTISLAFALGLFAQIGLFAHVMARLEPVLGSGPDRRLVAAGCTLFGSGVGNLVPLPPLIAQRECRLVGAGTVVARVTALNQAVFAVAPAIFGALRDLTGRHVVSFLVPAAIQALAAVIVGWGRRFS